MYLSEESNADMGDSRQSQFTHSVVTHFRDDLCQDISQLFENTDDYNVKIQVGSGLDIKEFEAHSVILRARCPYFKTVLSDNWVKKIENIYYFQKPNISPAVFFLILRYIYTGTLDLTDQSGSNTLALLVAVDELLLNQLINHVQKHLIRKESNWLKENFVMALSTISKLQSCKEIQDYVMKTIELPINSKSDIQDLLAIANELTLIQLIDRIQVLLIKNEPSWFKEDLIGFLCNIFNDENYKKINDYIIYTICIDPEPLLFELTKFPTLERNIVLEFIKRDDLAVEEIDVWKYLVKWTTAQFSSLNGFNVDVNYWGENEFKLFKKNIEPFISYVRFCEITRDEFYYYVMPYEKALPENLYKSLIGYFMANLKVQNVILQSRNGLIGLISIDSAIIKRKHARIIIRWIERITALTKKRIYMFTCIYRATHCNFHSENFTEMLNDFSCSKVALIKVKDSDRIIGGFNNNESWIMFRSGKFSVLELYGQKGNCSVLNDYNFITEEIEIFKFDNIHNNVNILY
ncbi:serine-enriched protein [Gigaspora margarita]|uniref:Serine-enriched protein n=1 Tax=Gigaspora margarita TaxID=4874 RepID=A0A8H4ES58_GIGMA|nr:serine-enriched protein [Gigaspora margarita]